MKADPADQECDDAIVRAAMPGIMVSLDGYLKGKSGILYVVTDTMVGHVSIAGEACHLDAVAPPGLELTDFIDVALADPGCIGIVSISDAASRHLAAQGVEPYQGELLDGEHRIQVYNRQ